LPQIVLPLREARTQKQPKSDKRKPPVSEPAVAKFRLPLRCPQGFVVQTQVTPRPEAEPLPLPTWGKEEAAEVDRMLSPSGQPAPPARILLDLGRLQARWRSALKRPVAGGLDIDRTVQTLARNEWPQPLPQRARPYRIQDVHVCIDLHPDRQHLIHDYCACLDLLIATLPNARLQVHEIDGAWCWERLLAATGPGQAMLLLAEPSLMPEAERRMWQTMQQRMTRQGAVVLWSLDWLPEAWGGQPDAARATSPAAADAALSQLLACLAPAVTVEPALVRALIHALQLPGGLALEQAVWCHPDLDGALPYRQWYPERQQAHLQTLRVAPPAVIDICGRVLRQSHVHVHQVQRDQELLNWAGAASDAQIARLCGTLALDDAKLRYARVAQHLLGLKDNASEVGLADTSSPGVVCAAAMERLQSLPYALGAVRQQLESLLLQAAQPPDARYSMAMSGAEDAHAPLSVWLFQQGQRLLLVQINFVGPGAHMATLNIDARWLIVECDGLSRVVWRPHAALLQGAIILAEWERVPPHSLRLCGAGFELQIKTVKRPHWAAEFAQQRGWAGAFEASSSRSRLGMEGLIYLPDGRLIALDPSAPEDMAVITPHGWRLEFDRYGPRLSLDSLKISLEAVSRFFFRYIPPGTYLQGSPEGLGHDDENPQHPVTLTQGLWLAETPCTQALWQAVMGKNPSHFKGGADAPRRPVEMVSWDDVTAFLKQLQPLLPPGCEAVLPTESQWEYACRAGTQTEYWWGDEADNSRANWDGQYSRTTPVDRYPSNPWGLYDMHGNVLEWCADDQRDYAAEPARDPEGPDAGDFRVVRGGSRFSHPDSARAAFRDGARRWDAIPFIGFRFALRSPGGPEARPGGLGASRRGGAAGSRTDGADAPAAEPPLRDVGDARTPE
jgi:hypothetical protein